MKIQQLRHEWSSIMYENIKKKRNNKTHNLLSHSLGLGDPYSTHKMVLSFKDINIYKIINFKARGALDWSP